MSDIARLADVRRHTQAAAQAALDFRAWQRLRASGLSNAEAGARMTRAILCQ